MKATVISTLAAIALGGCASVPKEAGYADVGRMVEERTGQKTHWDQDAPEDAEVAKRLHDRFAAILIVLLHGSSRGLTEICFRGS